MSFGAFVGTYTTGNSKGIYYIAINPISGHIEVHGSTSVINPSYVAISKDGKYLYSVCEGDRVNNEDGGAVCSFEIQPDKSLKMLSMHNSRGTYPCHISLGRDESFLYTANYGNGTAAVFGVNNGVLSEAVQVICHEGHGVNLERQEGPHTHFISHMPVNDLVAVVDLGIDRINFYRQQKGSLVFEKSFCTNPGSGPRHLAFPGDERFAWLVCELSSEIYAMDVKNGFSLIDIYSTLPVGFNGSSTCAAVKLSPDGSKLCASNRGHDSIAYYHVDTRTGRLALKGIYPSGGNTPRDIAFTPDGKYLLVANQESDLITVCKVEDDGLVLAEEAAVIPAPVCIAFTP